MEVKLTEVNTESAKPKVNIRDLESRSHWDNIRIFGPLENVEGPLSTTFILNFYTNFLVMTNLTQCQNSNEHTNSQIWSRWEA